MELSSVRTAFPDCSTYERTCQDTRLRIGLAAYG
jgi:hypothetical protein